MNNDSANTNTILIVFILLILVGGGVWYFTRGGAPADDTKTLDIDVTLPTGGSGDNTAPSGNQ